METLRNNIFILGFVSSLVCIEIGILNLTTLAALYKETTTGKTEQYEEHCSNIPATVSSFKHYVSTPLCVAGYKNLWFFDVYHDTINAFSTLCVAIFTFTLWRSTNKLFQGSERQSNYIDRSSKIELRSYINIVPTRFVVTKEHGIAIQYVIHNGGKTPAREVETDIYVAFDVDFSSPISNPNERRNGLGTMFTDATYPKDIIVTSDNIGQPVVQYIVGGGFFCLIGRVDYFDVFNIKQWAKFGYRVRLDNPRVFNVIVPGKVACGFEPIPELCKDN